MKIVVEIDEQRMKVLSDLASLYGIPAEELASAVVRDVLSRGGEELQTVARQLLEQNRELYRRLA